MKTKLSASARLLFAGLVLLSLPFAPVAQPQDLPPEVLAYPETILFNGKILTVDEQFSTAEAVAIRGERILAVGSNDRISRMAGPNTERIDLQGKTVVPGFIETHAHLGDYVNSYMTLEENGIPWEGNIEWVGLHWKDVDMAFRDIGRAVDAASPGELVRIMVFLRDEVLPQMTMERLDAISPRNPVVLITQVGSRPRAANTKAFELAKIAPGTPGLPQDGGVLIAGEAGQLLTDYLMWNIPLEKLVTWHRKAMERVNSWGMTTVTTRITADAFNAVRDLWVRGDLTLRWRVAFPGPLDIPHTGNVSDIGDNWLRISGGGSGFVPGIPSALAQGHWSSKLIQQSGSADASGISNWPQLRQRLLETLRYGWSTPNSHVLGDIAVHEFLDVIEEAQSNPVTKSSNQRFTMDHMVEIDERDIPRMKRLGVIPSSLMKDVFAESVIGSSTFVTAFGTEYVNKLLPLKKYLDAGIPVTVEADTGETLKGEPLWTIEKAVCRCVDGSSRVWGQDQKVSRRDALRMKTIWGAKYNGDEKILGSLEPGKLADLVVLDGDYMTVPEDRISDLKVALTIVGGGTAYSTLD